MTKVSGKSLMDATQQACIARNKIYVPSDHEESIAFNIATWLNNNNVSETDTLEMLRVYVSGEKLNVNLSRFAGQMQDLFESHYRDKASKERFKRIVAETRQRMEGN